MYRIDEGRVAVIENGVDISEFHPGVSADYVRNSLKLEGRFVIGFVGSFRPWHGIEHLIALAEVLTIDLPQAIFLIVGDGPDRVLYEGQVQEKRLSEHFNFRGYVCHSQVPSYLASMDVVLAPHSLSSFKKGFYGSALKIFEYMAMGKPVIASPLGQIRDLIEDGVSGRLIHAEDSMRLKNAILDLYRDPSYRKRLGHNARVMVEKQFTWEVNAAKVERLCQEACNA
jgi:glycosyltransferase involved in cell wall biosynthesis